MEANSSPSSEYEVEAVLGERFFNKKKEYFVKWKVENPSASIPNRDPLLLVRAILRPITLGNR